MTKIFLEDIIKTVLRRGAVTCNRYYNIIIPELSDSKNISLAIDHCTDVVFDKDDSTYTHTCKDIKYTIRRN